MIEILHNLFVGTQYDYETLVKGQTGWEIVQACREPYHRRELGYTSPNPPKGHPEYLFARRENRLILNLLETSDPDDISGEVDAAVEFIHAGLNHSHKILVHCVLGTSRSPCIGLLYLARYTDKVPREFTAAEEVFRQIYPDYSPSPGMQEFMLQNWYSFLAK